MTFDLQSLSSWITAFFVLAGLAATLAVVGVAMVLPRRTVRAHHPAHHHADHRAPAAPAATRENVLEGAGARS